MDRVKSYSRPENFRTRVLDIVRGIRSGKTLSYQQVAGLAGNPKAARAVGAILKTNYNEAIPCHRVIRGDGDFGGYNRGAELKRKILIREREEKSS